MHLTFNMLLIVCPLVFLAGLVDSIGGGGGLISLPAYMLAGLPIHFVYGTNKLSSMFGTIFSTLRYGKTGNVLWKIALPAVAGALTGSFIGARLALLLDDKMLKSILVVIFPIVALVVLMRGRLGKNVKPKLFPLHISMALSGLIGIVIGSYDGFFGPGTGTFLILSFTGILGMNLTVASGTSKVVNLASNIAALATFSLGSSVFFALGLPAAVCGIAGNWIGSGLAIRRGEKIIRPVMLVVIAILFVKIIYDFIK